MYQDCESSEWVELKQGTFKECEDYQKKDEAKQLEYGISVDYKKREMFYQSSHFHYFLHFYYLPFGT
jgi:hypothetical protein